MFSPFWEWYNRQAFASLFAGFALPKWAQSAFTSLIIAIWALFLAVTAPLIGKIIIGFFVGLCSLAVVSLLLLFGGSWAALRVGVHLGKIAEMPPVPSWPGWWDKMGGPVGLAQNLLFWVWGIFYVAEIRIHLFNRIALIVWAALFLGGCLIAVVNGVSKWIRLCRRPPGAA